MTRRHCLVLYLLVSAVLIAGACGGTPSRHSALAPRALPTPRTGQPMTGVIEAGLTHGTIVERSAPETDDDAGIHAPRHQVRGELRFRTRGIPKLELGFIHERGLPYQARSLDGDGPEPEGSASSVGVSVFYPAQLSSGFHLGLGLDAMMYLVPYVDFVPCVGECAEPFEVLDEGRDVEPVFGLSVSPAYDVTSFLALFSGITVRNHPTIVADGEGDVEFGTFNVTAGVGAAVTIPRVGVRAAVQVYHTVNAAPVRYAPTLAVSVSVPLFREKTARAPIVDSNAPGAGEVP